MQTQTDNPYRALVRRLLALGVKRAHAHELICLYGSDAPARCAAELMTHAR